MCYIYAADLWCDSCGAEICERLKSEGKAPKIPQQSGYYGVAETYYDSDDYPKYRSDPGESDSPSHCGSGPDCLEAETLSDGSKVGALLGFALTSGGFVYVSTVLAEALTSPNPIATFWAQQFPEARPKPDDPEVADILRDRLEALVDSIVKNGGAGSAEALRAARHVLDLLA